MTTPARRILAGTAAAFGLVTTVAGCAGAAGPASPSSGPAAPSPSVPSSTTAYADGRYRADGVYGSGPSSIGVQLTLAGGRITAVSVTPHATNPTSLGYQRDFAGAVAGEVVGRPIAGLQVGRLAGSSSTPDGFNDALTKIRADAAA